MTRMRFPGSLHRLGRHNRQGRAPSFPRLRRSSPARPTGPENRSHQQWVGTESRRHPPGDAGKDRAEFISMSNRLVTKKLPQGKRKITRAEQALRTSDRILRVAIKLFAARGYHHGVSVDEIVKAARVNKRMVYHYYGDKAGLYAAVLTNVYSRLAEIEADVFRDQPLRLRGP